MNRVGQRSFMYAVGAVCLAFAAGCSTPSAPTESNEPQDTQKGDEDTSLLEPAPDHSSFALAGVCGLRVESLG